MGVARGSQFSSAKPIRQVRHSDLLRIERNERTRTYTDTRNASKTQPPPASPSGTAPSPPASAPSRLPGAPARRPLHFRAGLLRVDSAGPFPLLPCSLSGAESWGDGRLRLCWVMEERATEMTKNKAVRDSCVNSIVEEWAASQVSAI